MGNRGIFDEDIRLAKLSELGDSLVKLNRVINWEMFRPLLSGASSKENKGKCGRPPFDCVLMFKVLVLQRIYNLSDDQTEYQINDRMSFMRFLGLGLEDRVPDAKTIWLFRDTLVKAGIMHELFNRRMSSYIWLTGKWLFLDLPVRKDLFDRCTSPHSEARTRRRPRPPHPPHPTTPVAGRDRPSRRTVPASASRYG